MNESILNELMVCLSELPFISTQQAASFFPNLKWSQKEASRYLRELESRKLVEGYDRKLGESKIWRMTLKGKKEYGLDQRALPFTVRNIEHHLGLGECYFDLKDMGGTWVKGELREVFVNREGKQRKYCPDAFFIYEKQPFFLEFQRSYLSRVNWSKKWEIANEFFSEGHHRFSSVSTYLPEKEIPIVVVTSQSFDVVNAGARVPLIVLTQLKELMIQKFD